MNKSIIDIIKAYTMVFNDSQSRSEIKEELNKNIFKNAIMNDITTPDGVDNLQMTFSIEYDNEPQKILSIHTVNRNYKFFIK